MISRPDMEICMADLMRWCKVAMTEDQIRIMHKKLKDQTIDALQFACDRFMEDRKQSPANFPTVREIINMAAEYYMMNPGMQDVEYDYFDDDKYPYSYLVKAFVKLTEIGFKSFKAYCDHAKMPLHDRERVLRKAIVAGFDQYYDLMVEVRKERKHGQRGKQNHQGS